MTDVIIQLLDNLLIWMNAQLVTYHNVTHMHQIEQPRNMKPQN